MKHDMVLYGDVNLYISRYRRHGVYLMSTKNRITAWEPHVMLRAYGPGNIACWQWLTDCKYGTHARETIHPKKIG